MVDFHELKLPSEKLEDHKQHQLARERELSKPNAELVSMALSGERLRDELITRLGRNIAETLLDIGITKSCLNCDHWNTNGKYGTKTAFNSKFPEGCMKYQMLPPPVVIVKGCDKHTDQIPF